MALAFATTYRDVEGSRYVRRVQITLDNSYPNGGTKATNGWPISALQLGFGSGGAVTSLIIENPHLDGYHLEWDAVNGRLHVHQGDNPNAAVAPGIELPNASAVMNGKVVNVLARGTGQHL